VAAITAIPKEIKTGALGMMVRGLTTTALLALMTAGALHAQALQSDDSARPDALSAPADSVTTTAASAAADGSVTANAPASETGLSAADASLPNAPLPNSLPGAPLPKTISGYQRPTEKEKLVNYLFDAYGPFPIVGSALVAGINQADNSPRNWDQGLRGYGRRWGSDFGIAAITTTTRYGLAEILREDTLYYRCECSGVFPRLRHALISTFTGRRGEDGHRVFSVPSLVAPYAGSFVAVYAWYPQRYDASDAFRSANYSLLAYAAGNVVLEFFPTGPHSLLSRFHLQNRHGAPENSN
jgi:hypothetical protein